MMERSALVPELVVSDLARSLAFWRDLVGFSVLYDRPEDGFAYLEREDAEVMLGQYHREGRHWLCGAFASPLGNGVSLQIKVSHVAPILDRLSWAGWPLVMDPEDKWYRVGDGAVGQRQFVVADPDGYRLRLAEDLRSR